MRVLVVGAIPLSESRPRRKSTKTAAAVGLFVANREREREPASSRWCRLPGDGGGLRPVVTVPSVVVVAGPMEEEEAARTERDGVLRLERERVMGLRFFFCFFCEES